MRGVMGMVWMLIRMVMVVRFCAADFTRGAGIFLIYYFSEIIINSTNATVFEPV